jgi:hypothetical protein
MDIHCCSSVSFDFVDDLMSLYFMRSFHLVIADRGLEPALGTCRHEQDHNHMIFSWVEVALDRQ